MVSRIHITAQKSVENRAKVADIIARFSSRCKGDEIVTICDREGTNRFIIPLVNDNKYMFTVVNMGVGRFSFFNRGWLYLDMSKQINPYGHTYNDIAELEVHLITTAHSILFLGDEKYCKGAKALMDEIQITVPKFALKKIVAMEV